MRWSMCEEMPDANGRLAVTRNSDGRRKERGVDDEADASRDDRKLEASINQWQTNHNITVSKSTCDGRKRMKGSIDRI